MFFLIIESDIWHTSFMIYSYECWSWDDYWSTSCWIINIGLFKYFLFLFSTMLLQQTTATGSSLLCKRKGFQKCATDFSRVGHCWWTAVCAEKALLKAWSGHKWAQKSSGGDISLTVGYWMKLKPPTGTFTIIVHIHIHDQNRLYQEETGWLAHLTPR